MDGGGDANNIAPREIDKKKTRPFARCVFPDYVNTHFPFLGTRPETSLRIKIHVGVHLYY